MKRITACLLIAVLLLGATACGTDETTAPTLSTTFPQQTTQPTTEATDLPPTTTLPDIADPVVVDILLDPNGGSCDRDAVDALVGDYYAVYALLGDCYGDLPVPVLEGYVFLGWFTQPEGGERVEADMALISDQMHTLYAQWEVKTRFTVTFDPNGGRISPYRNEKTMENGDTYDVLPEPIREGYKFLGWYTQPEKGVQVRTTTKFTEGQDLVLYARWQYDAQAYWSYVLENTVQQIPQCRRVVVYLERNSGYKTYTDCDFLNDAGAINPAEGLEDYKVTDAWIESVQPYIIVKLTSDTSLSLVAKTGMLRRFPDAEVYVFSTSVINGSAKYQLYCRLYLAKLLYPEYFEDVDLAVVKKELNVSANIYY